MKKPKEKQKPRQHVLAATISIYIILCMLFYATYGFTWGFLPMAIYSYLLILITLSDIQRHIIPNKLIIAGIIVALLTGIFYDSMISTLIGGAIGLVIMVVPVIFKAKVGIGDVKLGILIGMMIGYPLAIMALILPWILGLVIAGVLMILKRTTRGADVPFAVFLSASAIITMLWGGNVWQLLTG